MSPDRKGGGSAEIFRCSLALHGLTYLITFSCYGSHVPGDEHTTSRKNHQIGAPREQPNPALAKWSRNAMTHPAFDLDSSRRQIVLNVIREVCRYRVWDLLAAHVRTTHVHVVIAAEARPEKVMNDLKSYATRALRCGQKVWARHGSTQGLWTQDAVDKAVSYVASKQGEPMAVYVWSPR